MRGGVRRPGRKTKGNKDNGYDSAGLEPVLTLLITSSILNIIY